MPANITRGMHRVGLVLAAPLVALGLLFVSVLPFASTEPFVVALYGVLMFAGAGAIYGACRALGWIIAGFLRD